MSRPRFWIVAGANGSGKTTIVSRPEVRALLGDPEALNPDVLVPGLREADPTLDLDAANLEAARRTEARVDALLEARRSLLVETVLSSGKYLPRVELARAGGFVVGMVYVALPDPELAVLRVAQRVRRGGHAVPEAKIRDRWHRSHAFLARFVPLLDALFVFGNADPDGDAELVARKAGGRVLLDRPGVLPEIDRVLAPFLG